MYARRLFAKSSELVSDGQTTIKPRCLKDVDMDYPCSNMKGYKISVTDHAAAYLVSLDKEDNDG